MGITEEKLKLAIDIQVKNAREIAKLQKELKELGGSTAVKSAKELKKLQREIKLVGDSSGKSAPLVSKLNLSIAKGMLLAKAGEESLKLLKDGFDEIAKATLVAARTEVLNTTLAQMGKNANISGRELLRVKNAVIALGITQSSAIAIEQRFMQAKLNLADATKVARVAQDAAVVADTNSSEAALQITDAINKRRPILLRQFGIMVDLNQVDKEYAKTLGKVADELTPQEKKQALLNAVLREGAKLSGNYVAAMENVGKRMQSLPRLYEAAQVAIGQHFLPVLRGSIDTAERALKGLTDMFETVDQSTNKIISQKIAFEENSKAQMEMVNTYETLTAKESLSIEEHETLTKTVDTLSKLFPGAISEWNKYGKAIGLNTIEIKRQIDAKRSMFRVKEADSIKKLVKEWKKYQEQIAIVVEMKNKTKGEMLLPAHDKSIVQVHDTTKSMKQLKDELSALRSKENELQGKINDVVVVMDQAVDATDEVRTSTLGLSASMIEGLREYQNYTKAIEENTKKKKENNVTIGVESLFPEVDFVGNAKGVISGLRKPLFDISDMYGKLNLNMKTVENSTIQGFRNMTNSARSFFDELSQGTLSFGGIMNLIFTGISLYSSISSFGATSAVSAAVGSTSPAPVSGMNIGGNLIIQTQASSALAVAKEIENLSSRNMTTIITPDERITR